VFAERRIEIEGVAIDEIDARIASEKLIVEIRRIFDGRQIFRLDAARQNGLGDDAGARPEWGLMTLAIFFAVMDDVGTMAPTFFGWLTMPLKKRISSSNFCSRRCFRLSAIIPLGYILVIVKKRLRTVDPIWRKNKAKCRNWKNSHSARKSSAQNQKRR
jgi:hypothetical protein